MISSRTYTPAQFDAYLAAFNVLVERFPDMISRDVNTLAWDLAHAMIPAPADELVPSHPAWCVCGHQGCPGTTTAPDDDALLDDIMAQPMPEIELTEVPADVHADVPAGRLMEIPAVNVLAGDYVALFGRVVPGGYVLRVDSGAIFTRVGSLARTGRATIVRPN